jgi:hypothetical protein
MFGTGLFAWVPGQRASAAAAAPPVGSSPGRTHVMLIPALRSRLLAADAVTDLVGTHIWTLELPQSAAYPAIRLQEISRVLQAHLRGQDDLVVSRVQVDSFARKGDGDAYALAWAVADAAAGAFVDGAATGLAGFRGPLGAVDILSCVAGDATERYETANNANVVRVISEYFVYFKAAAVAA